MVTATAISANAATLIREWIEGGKYPAGSLLPSQRDLAEQLGISRTSLREALSTLQGLGLVVSRPGKGVYVAADATDGAPPQWRFSKSHSLTDIYQLRFALESFTVGLAAAALLPEDVGALRENAEAMRACIDASDFTQAARLDFEFHMRIIAIAGNRAIADILRNSTDVMQESQRLPFYQRGSRHATYTEHCAIIDALAAGDASLAQRAMSDHIVRAAQRAGVHFPAGSRADGGMAPERRPA
ncbi:FadR/GntR family transcriptional regulator [Cupriavidus sp. 2MCAB6]|uniref:FadR/GntR family transcriptional regulator n=1 Tax=Cupriavidus sp. 2MCAB6 TaxID=3232981 RepID=UPI003F90FD29